MSREEGQPCRGGVGAGLLLWLPPAGAWKTGAVYHWLISVHYSICTG